MSAQIIWYACACALGLAVVIWAGMRGPRLLARYFEPHGLPTPAASHLVYLTALVEAAVLFAGFTDPFLTVTLPLSGVLAMHLLVDGTVKKLPNALTVIGAGLLAVGAVIGVVHAWQDVHLAELLFNVAVGALVWFLPLFVVRSLGGSVGRGDIKLAPLLGAWLGLYSAGTAFGGLVTGFVIGGVYACVLLVARRARLKDTVAFGPAMISGAALIWLMGSGTIASF
ncbi:prepilin peptidase [Gleimia hominis]|uniref:Prepilin peptidase n=1 Tax=Gleimia hominis TaxID=595468 RepID=A0ABU3IBC1_9ACTO|nr:prepilin peptidase [Gleimia hominis]MDT3767679.1 prepilin peptidase [Gleimia hominis]